MMDLLGYAAAVVLFAVFLLFFHDVLVDEDETKTGLNIDLPVAATFLIVHAIVAALTSPVFALIGSVAVVVVMLRPGRWVKRRMETAGFDLTPRTLNAPVDETPASSVAQPVETRQPVAAGSAGLTSDESAVWEDLTRRLND